MADAVAPSLSITIVGYNSLDDLRRCIASIDAQQDAPTFEVIVVDNASADGTVGALRTEHPLVSVIENDRNVGFGTAHNQAASVARGKWLLLLNPDTVLAPGTLRRLVDAGRTDTIVAPRLVFHDGTLQRSAHRRWPSVWSHLYLYDVFAFFFLQKAIAGFDPTLYPYADHERPLQPLHVMGAALLMDRERFIAIGGFDERYFLYLEETDLCRRFLGAGGSIDFRPDIAVTHTLGGSSGAGKLGQGSTHFMSSTYRYLAGRYGEHRAQAIKALTLLILRVNNVPLAIAGRALPRHEKLGIAIAFNRAALDWHRRNRRVPCAS